MYSIEAVVMPPLERLFRLEVQFHERLRAGGTDAAQGSGTHTSWALQAGYEQLIKEVGRVDAAEVVKLTNKMLAAADPRDVLAARDSVMRLLGIKPIEGS
jgi:hypothetical protein